jgi:hypothetical protein
MTSPHVIWIIFLIFSLIFILLFALISQLVKHRKRWNHDKGKFGLYIFLLTLGAVGIIIMFLYALFQYTGKNSLEEELEALKKKKICTPGTLPSTLPGQCLIGTARGAMEAGGNIASGRGLNDPGNLKPGGLYAPLGTGPGRAYAKSKSKFA